MMAANTSSPLRGHRGLFRNSSPAGCPRGKAGKTSDGEGYKPSFAGIFTLLRPRRPHSGGLGNRSSRRFLRNQDGGCEWVTVWLVRSSKAGGTPVLPWSGGGWRRSAHLDGRGPSPTGAQSERASRPALPGDVAPDGDWELFGLHGYKYGGPNRPGGRSDRFARPKVGATQKRVSAARQAAELGGRVLPARWAGLRPSGPGGAHRAFNHYLQGRVRQWSYGG